MNANSGVGEVVISRCADGAIIDSNWVVGLTVGDGHLGVTEVVSKIVAVVADGASVTVDVVGQTELNGTSNTDSGGARTGEVETVVAERTLKNCCLVGGG